MSNRKINLFILQEDNESIPAEPEIFTDRESMESRFEEMISENSTYPERKQDEPFEDYFEQSLGAIEDHESEHYDDGYWIRYWQNEIEL